MPKLEKKFGKKLMDIERHFACHFMTISCNSLFYLFKCRRREKLLKYSQ